MRKTLFALTTLVGLSLFVSMPFLSCSTDHEIEIINWTGGPLTCTVVSEGLSLANSTLAPQTITKIPLAFRSFTLTDKNNSIYIFDILRQNTVHIQKCVDGFSNCEHVSFKYFIASCLLVKRSGLFLTSKK
jgi:hypothetical protein